MLDNYPKENSILFEMINTKGLDDEEILHLKQDLKEAISTHTTNDTTTEGDAILYELHENLREVISKYNDSVRGRCWVCLEDLCED